ncbi:tetratricopeptide repeat protein [Aquirhabdus parva]|nr:tetratricopeptide repeat protein [Aquirhabdus parva]
MRFQKKRWMSFITAMAFIVMAVVVWRWQHHEALLSANDIEELQVRAIAGRDSEAVKRLSSAAEDGQMMAQRVLGLALIQQNKVAEGIQWLKQASAQGDNAARFALGKLYFQGSSVPQDYHQAFTWLKPAAEEKYAPAAYYLGVIYKNGYGIPVDAAEAAKWFKVGADQKQPVSLFMLANAYRDGEGVPQSDRDALSLYKQAAELELPEAIQTLALAYQNGEMGLSRDKAAYQEQVYEIGHSLKHPALRP